MKRSILALTLLLGGASAAVANSQVPSLDTTQFLSTNNPAMNAKEARGARLAREWISNNNNEPVRGDNGSITYLYGAGMPAVVCAPLRLCSISLEPGEVVNNINIADSVRWNTSLGTSGSGQSQTTHVMVKPTDVGLETSMSILTNRRDYQLTLKSRTDDWMPEISFVYPSNIQQEVAEYRQQVQQHRQDNTITGTGHQVADLDFEYRIEGEASWRPVRVYNDGVKTVIQMPASMQHREAPVLVSIGPDDQEQIVNYRLRGDRFIVDQLFDRAALVAGVGDQQTRVTIERQ
ncbi:P-type conjugative transfer protein TrbG [Vreelandella alkaliphila]|uniref:P-type conjugative transfer protein TrbG n=1 Tax=Halomonadaceae TaxID=28256 RepID=UPI0013D14B3C|nr:P-type conjugative transfer protein TrbG [Modicisalibacter sp. 'Wilcox']